VSEHVGEEPRPERRVTDPRQPGFTCLNCGEASFTEREVKLNTSGMSLMNLDWANKSGNGFICNACGFLQVFALDARQSKPGKYFGQP
jgi:hypothetical protein